MKIWNSIKSFIREHDSASDRRETERLARVAAESPPEPTERELRMARLLDNPWLECLAIVEDSIRESEARKAQWENERVAKWNEDFMAAPPELKELMLHQENQRHVERRHKETIAEMKAAAAADRARMEDQLRRERISLYFQ